MNKESLREKLEKLAEKDGEERSEQYLLLYTLYKTMNNRHYRDYMMGFACEGLERLKAGKELPREWVEFAFEQLARAGLQAWEEDDPKTRQREVTRALSLSGRKDPNIQHLMVVELILINECLERHSPDPLGNAIDFIMEKHPGRFTSKKVLRGWYQQHAEYVLQTFVDEGTPLIDHGGNSILKQWAKSQLAIRNRTA